MCTLEILFLVILLFCPGQTNNDERTPDPSGHNLPLGSHTEHLEVPSLTEFPLPGVFFEEYMSKSRPVIIRSVLNSSTFPAVVKWNDDFFRNVMGHEEILAEPAKKEIRTMLSEEMSVATFLDVYKNRELYMVQGVDELPAEIKSKLMDDVHIPRSLLCGGLQFSIESLVLWFSSGGTKSVLHGDDYENFNCVLDGNKELIFIDKKYKEQVESVGFHDNGSYSDVDVDKVDMYKFSRLQETTVYKARLTRGDCLYIPYQWYHQVNSPGGRSLAINFWFYPTLWFNHTDCENKKFPKQMEPVKNYGIRHEDYVAWNQFIWHLKDDITKSEYKTLASQEFPALAHLVDEIFQKLDKDGSSTLSIEELYNVDSHKMLEEFPAIMAAVMSEYKETDADSHDEL